MELAFKNVGRKNRTLTFCFIALFFIIPQTVHATDGEKWQPVPEASYPDILELIALRTKANYDEISSWQGRINIFATDHYYGPNAAEKSHGVDVNSIARDSQHICLTAKTIADFAVDVRNNKLYSDFRPIMMQYKAVDLNQNVPLSKFTGSSSRTRTILTPEVWMRYETEYEYNPKYHEGRASKMAFIDVAQKEVYNTQDPRKYFDIEVNRKVWEVVLLMRKMLLDVGNIRIEGYPCIEITSMETSSGIKYRIMSTSKLGDVIKYLRILLEVDEAVGFNVIKREETYPDGIKRYSTKYTYEDFNGVFIPKTFWMESRNNKGELTGTSEITIETTGINKPLPEDTFSIKNLGVEEGTLVSDNIKKAGFRYSKGNLVPIADSNK